MWVLHKGNGVNECDLASNVCEYDMRKRDLFVLGGARCDE